MTEWMQLIEWLATGQSRRLGDTIERLLQFGRVHHDATERAFRHHDATAMRSRMHRSLAPVIPAPASAILRAEACHRLADWLGAVPDTETIEQRAFRVRMIAKQFDRVEWAKAYVAWVTAAGPVERHADEIVPRLSPFDALGRMYGKGNLASRPGSLGSQSELNYFGLLPSQMPYGMSVRLHGGWDCLDRTREGTGAACAIPWCYSDLEILEVEPERFFGVRAREPADRERALHESRMLTDGDEGGFVLLPEVCAEHDVALRIAEHLATQTLIAGVAGSAHDDSTGVRRNVAYVVGRGGLRATQEKIVPMVHEGRTEDIAQERPSLEVFLGLDWSLAVVICRDFIDVKIHEVLRQLRPTIVLVPACSPKTLDFEVRAADLAAGQAHVMVANTCSPNDTEPAVVLWARPINRPITEQMRRISRHDVQLPHRWRDAFGQTRP